MAQFADLAVGARPARERFRPEVEGLRALAVLLVVIDHLFARPSGGFIGVDVFFVISGFLVTGILAREHAATGRISIPQFYLRRAKRILPASVAVLLATAVAAHLLFFPARARDTYDDIGWSAGFLANYHFAAVGTDYFNADRPPSPLQHFWSLAVEEQFYVFWPVLLIGLLWAGRRFVPARAKQLLIAVVTVVVLALFVVSIVLTESNRSTAYFSTLARAWELGVGAVLALALGYVRHLPRVVGQIALPAGLALIVWAAFSVSSSSAFPGPAAAPAVLGAALVILGGTGGSLPVTAVVLTNPVSRYIGRVSYSLYLWHWPVIIFLPSRLGVSSGAYFNVVAVLVMSAITVASYHFLEKPLRAIKFSRLTIPRLRLRPHGEMGEHAYAGLTVCLLVLVAGWTWTLRPEAAQPSFVAATVGQLPGTAKVAIPYGQITPSAALAARINAALTATSFPKLNPAIGNLSSAKVPEWHDCGNVGPAQLAKCTFTPAHPRADKRIVVIGDSYALSWLPAIRESESRGYTVYALTFGQCPAPDVSVKPSVGAASDFTRLCNEHRSWAVSEVKALKPAIVVLASIDTSVERIDGSPPLARAVTQWGAGTVKIIDQVRAAGARRVVLLSAPPRSDSLVACAPSKSSSPQQCVTHVSSEWHQVADAERAAVKTTKATYLDSRLLFCNSEDYCPAFIGTTPVKFDGAHLTGAYSASLGPVLGPRIIG